MYQAALSQKITLQRVAWLIKDPHDSISENDIIDKTFSRWTDPNKITRSGGKIINQPAYTNTLGTDEVIHIEAHGNPTNIAGIGYRKLASAIAKVFGSQLEGRKIIIHACETGSGVQGESETIYYIKKLLDVEPLKRASNGKLTIYAPERITISDYYGITRVVKPNKDFNDVQGFLSGLSGISKLSDKQNAVENFTMPIGQGWAKFVLNNYYVSGPQTADTSFLTTELNKIKSSTLIA